MNASSAYFTLLILLKYTICRSSLCYNSINPIVEAEKDLTDDSQLRTYILCPNTVFPIARTFDVNGTPQRGQLPLILGRSNVHVLCGEDGKSKNTCILEGGLFQVGFLDEFETGKPSRNTKLQGLTFKDARSVNLLAEYSGSELKVKDCVFRDNSNVSPIIVDRTKSTSGRSRSRQLLEGKLDEESRSSNLDDRPIEVEIVDSVFLDNVIWPHSLSTSDGLISILWSNSLVKISHSSFVGTRMEIDNLVPYYVGLLGGNLTMEDNCFVGGNPRIVPVINEGGVIIDNNRTFVQRYEEVKNKTQCDYRAEVKTGTLEDPDESFLSACHVSNGKVCTASSIRKVDVPCLRSLDEIFLNEVKIVNSNTTRTYLLCPKSEYRIDHDDPSLVASMPSSMPIIFGRPNMHVLCGATGSAKGDCVVTGGERHVDVLKIFGNQSPPITNAFISGVSFVDARSSNVHVQSDSNIHFHDCLFERNFNLACIILSGTLVNAAADMKVKVTGTLFADSTVGSFNGQTSGLVLNHGALLEIEGSTFTNISDVTGPTEVGYIIGSINGSISLKSNCFADSGSSLSPVVVVGGSVEHATGNFGENLETKGECGFITSSDELNRVKDLLNENQSAECHEFTASTCLSAHPPLALHDRDDFSRPHKTLPSTGNNFALVYSVFSLIFISLLFL